ncbi:MAG TPA: inositol monophosphatase family protein [Chlamydiales bacterium]|nr:inositol monophosphatase family protein [Chlamydiales bacterium]
MAEKKESLSRITLTAIEAALQAGELLRQGFGTQFSISSKEGRHNLVTEYDHKSEKLILDFLRQEIAGSNFLAEESGASGKDVGGVLWIVDPLDGTVNFAHQIPMFAVSIAAKLEGKVVSGVIYQPITHELFVAEIGKGAFLNGNPLRVSEVRRIENAIMATGFPYDLAKNPFHCIDHFVDILKLGIPIRRLGAAAIDLAYTAAGRFDGFFEVELAPWDVAAGKLLIEEAGGKVTQWDKGAFDLFSRGPILASNGHIHDAAALILNRSL